MLFEFCLKILDKIRLDGYIQVYKTILLRNTYS